MPREHSTLPRKPITLEPLTTADARNAVLGDAEGAFVCFEGVVRNHDKGQRVKHLEYIAHPDAATAMWKVADEIADEFGVRVFAQHRVGRLAVGEVALVAACAGAHRVAAFTACGALVDRIKEEVPIWKRQHFAHDSAEWVGL